MLENQQGLQTVTGMTGAQQSGPFLTSTLPACVGAVCSLQMDEDLKRVMEFMQSNVAASKLVNVAHAVATVAPVMWGGYERQEVRALALLTHESTSQPAAT